MNIVTRSAPITRAATLIFCLAALAACGIQDMQAPHIWGENEVPPEVKAEPRLVSTPQDYNPDAAPWPRLGDVPSMPKDFTPRDQINQTMQQMENDRDAALAKKEAMDASTAKQ